MAFKSYQVTDITTEQVVFTGAASTETTVIGFSVANVGNDAAYITAKLNSAHIVKGAPVAVGGTEIIVGGDQKLVVEAGDTLSVSSTSLVDIIISTLEV